MEAKLKENEEKAEKLTKHWLHKNTEAQKIFKVFQKICHDVHIGHIGLQRLQLSSLRFLVIFFNTVLKPTLSGHTAGTSANILIAQYNFN